MVFHAVVALCYSFDSTKVAKPIRPPILKGILEHLGAIGTGGTKKQTAEMMIPKKIGGPNKGSTRPASSNFGIDFDGII
jgi:hypothetical protein